MSLVLFRVLQTDLEKELYLVSLTVSNLAQLSVLGKAVAMDRRLVV